MKRFLAFVCAIVLQSSVAFASLEIENAFEDTGEGKNGFHGGLIVSLWDSKNDEEFSRFILCAGEKKLIDLSAVLDDLEYYGDSTALVLSAFFTTSNLARQYHVKDLSLPFNNRHKVTYDAKPVTGGYEVFSVLGRGS